MFMYQLLRSNKPVRSLLSLAVMAVMIPLLFSVSQADPDNIGDAFLLGAPWLIFAAAIFLAAVHFAIALPREYRRKKNELSPFSIKEATDKLPMGICFADPNGRIILRNNRMRRLSFALCGHELQIKSDMENALSVPDRSVTVKDDCYILPDKTVWQFRTQNITVDGDDRWQQITAHNVTELYNGCQKQEEINKELAEVNRELRKMYARMEDDVKEKESLDLKVYIHDTIGRSLLTIRDIIDSGEDTERKLEALQNAIGMLASNRVTSVSTMDEVKKTARQLAEAVKEAALLHARPHIGDVVHVQPEQIAGKHGAGAKRPPAQTKIDRCHQQAAARKRRQSQRPVFLLFQNDTLYHKNAATYMAPSARGLPQSGWGRETGQHPKPRMLARLSPSALTRIPLHMSHYLLTHRL